LGKGNKALVIGQLRQLSKELDAELTAIGAPSEEGAMMLHRIMDLLRGGDEGGGRGCRLGQRIAP
jgi:hypothetical protein